ncbi:MAG TPA: DUF455 family protein [Leptospiraceae bacterium]|nr:DUF455 family protein [Leptospiraceae bacterium]
MKTLEDFCIHILRSPSLADKLTAPPDDLLIQRPVSAVPEKPERENRISFSDKKSKIPRLEHLNIAVNRGISMHHFANHELQAVEIFAWAILKYSEIPDENRMDLFRSLLEEQKHLKLYLERMNEFEIEFGERPLNYIFWKFTPLMKTFEKFCAVMSVSIEGANLDYAMIYRKTFEGLGDIKSSEIMKIVYQDELKHVKRGYKVIEAGRNDQSDWEYYRSLLEHPFTPRRAKGYFFIPFTRENVGFSGEFIRNLGEYRDEFSNRKKEIIPEEMRSWGIYSG